MMSSRIAPPAGLKRHVNNAACLPMTHLAMTFTFAQASVTSALLGTRF